MNPITFYVALSGETLKTRKFSQAEGTQADTYALLNVPKGAKCGDVLKITVEDAPGVSAVRQTRKPAPVAAPVAGPVDVASMLKGKSKADLLALLSAALSA